MNKMSKIVLNPVINKLEMITIIAKINNLSNLIKRSTSFSDNLHNAYSALYEVVHPEEAPQEDRVLKQYRDLLSESLNHLGTFFIIQEVETTAPKEKIASEGSFEKAFDVIVNSLALHPAEKENTQFFDSDSFYLEIENQKIELCAATSYAREACGVITETMQNVYKELANKLDMNVSYPISFQAIDVVIQEANRAITYYSNTIIHLRETTQPITSPDHTVPEDYINAMIELKKFIYCVPLPGIVNMENWVANNVNAYLKLARLLNERSSHVTSLYKESVNLLKRAEDLIGIRPPVDPAIERDKKVFINKLLCEYFNEKQSNLDSKEYEAKCNKIVDELRVILKLDSTRVPWSVLGEAIKICKI